MSTLFWILASGAAIAALALTITLINLSVYRKSDPDSPVEGDPLISVCVPARNEEANIEACVRSLLANKGIRLEVLVYDDQSTDRTPQILAELCAEDPRVRAATTQPLPEEWNGKQHACWRMSEQARGDWLLFTDADVRFSPDALMRSVAQAQRLGAPMVSTFPRQLTGTLAEAAVVPMMFFLLFSYLPMWLMRTRPDPSCSAGCGQFLMATRQAYDACGGHKAWKDSMHDGIRMPRAVRQAGLRSDLFDGSDLCSVRMYRGAGEVWRGFAKNAFEGLGSVGLLCFLTVLHLVGHVLPWLALPVVVVVKGVLSPETAAATTAIGLSLVQRLVLAARTGHTPLSAVLHPVGVAAMTVIQWWSYRLHRLGKRSWRGRTAGAGEPV